MIDGFYPWVALCIVTLVGTLRIGITLRLVLLLGSHTLWIVTCHSYGYNGHMAVSLFHKMSTYTMY